jgi:hypothetical protein
VAPTVGRGNASRADEASACASYATAKHGRARVWQSDSALRLTPYERAGPRGGPQNHAARGGSYNLKKAAQLPANAAIERGSGLAKATAGS